MTWTPLDFGRYRGKTLPQVLFTDPDYFFWALAEGALRDFLVEADDLRRKATHIRVRQIGPDGLAVEYIIQPRDGRLADVTFVPKAQPLHDGGSRSVRMDVIDLSVPRRLAPYDKMGGGIVVAALKGHYFEDRHARVTRRRAERFFEDPGNFAVA